MLHWYLWRCFFFQFLFFFRKSLRVYVEGNIWAQNENGFCGYLRDRKKVRANWEYRITKKKIFFNTQTTTQLKGLHWLEGLFERLEIFGFFLSFHPKMCGLTFCSFFSPRSPPIQPPLSCEEAKKISKNKAFTDS